MKGAEWMLTCCGIGRLRPTPGTYASLPPIIIALLLAGTLPPESRWMIDVTIGLAAAWGIIVCIRFGALAEEVFGRKDPNQVVTDEVTGQSLALLFLPWFPPEESARNLIIAGIGFLTFRTFDIVKPYPAYQLQRLRHGWGILLDDLVAGIYAAVVTQATVRLFVTP
jgi:phosphatidylglycerophosphatase A